MIKVVIVEDEALLRKGLRYTFDWKSLNCVVVGEAECGSSGIDIIVRQRPDIVLTDIKMPIMDGLEMLQNLIEPDFETIIMTGFSEFEYARRAIDLGVAHFLLKPIDELQLIASIETIKERLRDKRQLKHLKEKQLKTDTGMLLGNTFYICDSKPQTGARYTEKIIDYVVNNYHRRFSLEELSASLGISTGYICKVFKEYTTYTFNDYLNRYRVQKSIELLRTGDYKLYEIADCTGFKDYKYYHHVFKSYMNCSPSEFLETHYLLGNA